MIRLKVFISSVQKELREERSTLGGLLATDPFLSGCMVPRLFEEYPAPLRPNKDGYLDLLRSCHIYLLVVSKEYGNIVSDGFSATHREYGIRRMRESMERHGLGLPQFALVGDEFTVTMTTHPASVKAQAPSVSAEAPDPLSIFNSLTEHQSAVLRRVLESGQVQTAWCVQNLGISRDTAWRLLNDLLEQGFLVTTGTGRGTRYVRGNHLVDQAQIGRNDMSSGANQAQTGRKDSSSGANRAQSHKPSSAVTRKHQSKRKKR